MQDQNKYDRQVLDVIRRDRLPGPAILPDLPWQRLRWWAWALMALLMTVSLYLLLNTGMMLDRFQGKLAGIEDNDTVKIRQYNQKLEVLQERMTAFVADSVETKLKTLEQNVADGSVTDLEIKTLEELKGEVRLLEKYSAGKGGNLADPSRLDHPRFQITPGTWNENLSIDLTAEVSQMKRLLYLGIASCGFVGFLLGGFWWQSHFRVKRLYRDIPPPKLLAGKLDVDP